MKKFEETMEYIHNLLFVAACAVGLMVYAVLTVPVFLIRWIIKNETAIYILFFIAVFAFLLWMMISGRIKVFYHW